MKTDNIIVDKSKVFALRIIRLYQYLKNEKSEFVLSKQLLRSGTSIGANVKEAIRGQSRADFYAKLNISLKEASETEYWLELLHESEYIEEKTGGKVRAGDVTCISLESLRAMDFDGIEAQLLAVHDYGHVIVNAVADCDVKVFAVALYRAMAKGRHFTIRSAAALVKAIGNISDQPLLTREKMVTQESKAGGIIVVGSHTKKTTAQLEELKKVQGIEFIEMDSDKVLVPGELEKEAAAIVAHCSQQIAKGITCCVSTKRVVLTLPDDTPEAALVRSVAISDALQSCVGRLTASPAFVVAKGGITSSDVGVKALRVKCAKVLGQIRPGIPVWQTGAESLFPGTPYIIFPGNVGEVSTLREAVEILLG